MLEVRNAKLPDGKVKTIRIRSGKIFEITDETGWEPHYNVHKLTVLPGYINLHVHDRTPGTGEDENWSSLVAAGLAGGMTYLCKMPNTNPSISTAEMLEESCRLVGTPVIPYSVWFGATPHNRREIELVAQDPRVCGVKMYMGSSTGDLLITEEKTQRQVFELCAALKLHLAVHAEDEAMMRQNRQQLGNQPLLTDHCIIRSTPVAVSATRRAVQFARETRCTLHVCHVSTPEEVEVIDEGRSAGASITCEVCPHHVILDSKELERPQGAGFYKMNPPLRSLPQKRQLRDYLCRPGMVDVVADDHAPHSRVSKKFTDYDRVPSGVPGVQTTVPLMLSLVHQGRLSLPNLVNLLATNPARILGLQNKGAIAVGYDADLIFLDPRTPQLITDEAMHYQCGWTPFAGLEGYGVPQLVMIAGKIVLNHLARIA
ncbi:MAG: dihydroorotase family protein [Candidatus Andersenbacteria bacterium]